MKPIRLHLKNFGPFLDETIDFSNIQSNQLFLISGKTGSGKTMIFDGMVYALYGRASTEKREVKHLRSHFAQPKEPLTVTFEFEINGGRYKVVREASFLKPGNKNETKPKLEVYHLNGDVFELVESTIQAGDQFILNLLKLKQDQFRQLFILPQGEFKSFLVSNSTDKQAILRTLFNTQLYDILKNELVDKTKNMKNEINQIYTKIQSSWDEMYTLDDAELVAEKQLKSEQYELILDALPMFQRIGQQQVDETAVEKSKSEAAMKKINEAVAREESRQQLKQQKADLEHKLNQLNEQQPRITELEKKLKLITESQVAIKTYQNKLEYEKTLNSKKSKQSTLTSEFDALKELETQDATLLEKHLAQQERIAQQSQFIQNTRHYFQQVEQLKQKQQRDQQINAQHQQLVEEMDKAKNELQQISEVDIEKKPDYEKKSQLQNMQMRLTEQHTSLIESEKRMQLKLKHEESLQQLNKQYENLTHKIEAQRAQLHTISSQDQHLLDHEKAVVTLRTVLQVDEPCPVCGQHVSHVDHGPEIEAIKSLQSENAKIEIQIRELTEQKIHCEADITHTKERINEIGDVQFDKNLLNENEAQLLNVKNDIEAVDRENKRIEALQQQVERINKVLDENMSQKQLLEKEQQHIQEQLGSFQQITGYDDIVKFQKAFEQIDAEVQDFEAQKVALTQQLENTQNKVKNHHYDLRLIAQQIDDVTIQLNRLDEELKTAMKQLDIADETTLMTISNESENKSDYASEVEQFHHEIQALQFKLQDVTTQILTIEPHDIDILKKEQQETQLQYESVQKQLNEFAFQVDQNKKTIQRIEREIAHLKQTLSAQIELFQLAEILNGKNEHNLTLENYVLMHFLEQILVKANQRLLSMTGQRYELIRNEKKGRGFSGLEIEVFDYYSNQSRHITSLSGGETFQASLALALGLCEVVQNEQGGIALDAMFIDEGFGTLDQETLETALDTLIQLQSSGRLVGIISHVTELKNRIPVILDVVSKNYQSTTLLRYNE
ncbi:MULTISPECIES: exonuclease subunit SbcC [Staphylococcus]|uniref:Nuclease SbcCD subunit C n=1 Tax=Staphylococcus schleiferi TaxID=1295 RepID=A0A7Z7QQG4_STASC|nr:MULTISPECIES: exonuclease subunit SbcC [Staphylococcus]EPD51944.1 exonuclease SbcC [Staphylococcus sp. HGB0015]NHA39872.1 SMC family ATPase [Staphylococcus schleiferi]RTX81437.1 SMC family ATPase [Staphylococcus schleiferi subsp. schleiferi]CAD7359903.1 exonuclease SbcC [Staphylococcus schleiferi]SUM89139.1 exonuclease SbcC [Staphylococcus schleiferi]